MNKYTRLGKNSALILIGSAGSKMLSVLMLPFYTAWLSVEKYGDIDLINTYVSLIMGVVTLCMTDAIFRFPQGKDISEQRKFFSSGLAVVAGSVACFGVVYYLLLTFVNCTTWGVFYSYSRYIFIFVIFNFLQLYLQQFCRSIDRVSVFVVSGLMVTVVTVITAIILVPKYGVNGFLLAQLSGQICASLYTLISINVFKYLSYKAISRSIIKSMLAYSVPMIPNATLWWILGTSNRLFLEYYHGTDAVGIFAVANKFPSIITMIANIFFLSWQISVLEEYEKKDFRQFYNRILKLCFVGMIGVSIILSISSYGLIKIFADKSYIEAWTYVPLLGLASVFSALSTFAGTMFMATKKTRYFLTTSIWGSMLCLLLNFILIRPYGIMGATVSMLVAHFAILCLRIKKSDKFVTLDNKTNYILQIAIALCISVSVTEIALMPIKIGVTLSALIIFFILNYHSLKATSNMIVQTLKKRTI